MSWRPCRGGRCLRGTNAELNRDEYTRPSFNERAVAYVQLVGAGIMSKEEVRMAERLSGPAPAQAMTGGPTANVSTRHRKAPTRE
jgi:hypothetical protein